MLSRCRRNLLAPSRNPESMTGVVDAISAYQVVGRAGTEPSIEDAAKKDIAPIIARRPLLSSAWRLTASVASGTPRVKPIGSLQQNKETSHVVSRATLNSHARRLLSIALFSPFTRRHMTGDKRLTRSSRRSPRGRPTCLEKIVNIIS